MYLSNVSTAQLVDELSKRDAVEQITVEPYQEYSVTAGEKEKIDTGPIVILRIWD